MKKLIKLLQIFTKSERKQAVYLLVMILIMALLDMLGVASIMPFIAVAANPELIETNVYLSRIYIYFGFSDRKSFLFILGLMAFILLVISMIFKALTTYAQLRFSVMREHFVAKRLMKNYLRQPYSWFLSRHSADLGKTILSEVGVVINGIMNPIMVLISQSAVAIAILGLLIVVDPMLSLTIGLVLGLAYGIIYKAIGGILERTGVKRLEANGKRFTAICEAFGAVKEVKVSGVEQAYVNRFSEPSLALARYATLAVALNILPRYLLEIIAFGGVLALMLFLMSQSGDFATALPVITLYAFAGYRLMPALQQLFGALAELRFNGPSLDALHQELVEQNVGITEDINFKTDHKLDLKQSIRLNNITYNYPNSKSTALKDISIEIPAKSIVGFVGKSGSGKTTVVDLILGLLKAENGTLEVDNNIITEDNIRSWQRSIGYVPQQIYLVDESISSNIAFGLDPKDIDQEAVKRACKIANLHDFVVNELPDGYATEVGERGVRLSGGQRQRIGIARALYGEPNVLIMDEATSALDSITEQAVMESVYNLDHKITIILIAHRLSTIKSCDKIYLIDNGELLSSGNYDELFVESEVFKNMAIT
jgi:ABC-type multidrug transport system fused ATPase/permease subunit